jgi:hypothetical protein
VIFSLDSQAIRTRPWLWPVVIGLLAIVASLSGISNEYAQDDLALLFQNPRMQTLRSIPSFLVDPYWPPPFIPALYRPLTSVSLALEWAAGGGAPIVFRLASYLLYAFAAVAFFRMARLRLPLAAAAAAAALFAVHPVHVESVAVAVNQSEIWVGLMACLMVAVYLRARSEPGPLPARTQLGLAGLYLVACAFKENALMIPGILLSAELLLVRDATRVTARMSQHRQLYLLLLAVAVAFYWVRTLVLSGSLSGTFVAEGLVGLTTGQRALTMLAVVPHWFRLLYWPGHLRADYSPGELVGHTEWGPDQTLGLLLLAAAVATMVLTWKRAPVIAFGIVWCAIALFPVHNVLVPTGIMLAERTLFLPSVGALLVLGGIGAAALERSAPRTQTFLALATGILVLLGIAKSAVRHTVWNNQFRLWYKTANEDAPRSFRAHEALADKYFRLGIEGMAEQEYRIAMTYAPRTFTRPASSYADRLRMRGHCFPAARIYRDVLKVHPNYGSQRLALVACLLDLGRYREAKFHARMGATFDWSRPVFQWTLAKADSAEHTGAPPGSVRVLVNPGDSASTYVKVGQRK